MHNKKPDEPAPIETQAIANNETDLAALTEYTHNGGSVDWGYWSARREITPYQAAKLVFCIDPIKWPADKYKQGPIDDSLRIKIQRCAEWLAERSQEWTLPALVESLGEGDIPFGMKLAVQSAPPAGKVGTNQKTWDDVRLRALWEESIQPGVTITNLAQKHKVSRQRISTLIANAKERFSTRGTSSPNIYAGLIVHKMKD